MNREPGVSELGGTNGYQRIRAHSSGKVNSCRKCNTVPCGSSNDGPSCESSPNITHHGSQDGSQCEPIAIIGMGCRLPGSASSPLKLWDLLTEARSAYCSVPKTRFNIDGFYHPKLDRMGTTNTKGGYFLSEDITSFENLFFGINNREATSMDPQQRKLLEVVYECFENAGMSMEALAGANVGCYVGNFTADFAVMQNKDPDLFTRYSATGMGATILANRLTHVFDLRGPSLVLDTACSSSLYCLHVACTALALRECDGAVVAGVNLIQGPEHHLGTAKAGILSASSTCNTFDISAEGYGRADGVGALYIKRLDDAIRDKDPIRSVIRATAVNSNGHTNGITLPSADGQEAVIRKAYAKAGLDVNGTHYVECHGTGTAVGDPIEVEALSRVFGERNPETPLLIGSVKTNVGHSEAASGITSIIKTTMALEQGLIPATIGVETLNPNIKASEWNVKVVTEQTPWPQLSQSDNKYIPRASVNSFGYGGANAHVIIEAAVVEVQKKFSKFPSPEDTCKTEPLMILPFSASNELSLQDRLATLSRLDTSSVSLRDLSHTLGSRRSHLPIRGYITVNGQDWRGGLRLEKFHSSDVTSRHSKQPYAFIFSGQGAQWPEMARQLLDRYPSFEATIRDLDNTLARLAHPPDLSIYDVIREQAETSKINIALYSQPVCTAVQIALVNLLAEFNIVPTAVVGHSSGEISAAYAAGHISATAAIVVAYYRGYAMSHVSHQGAMIAMGLSRLAAEELIVKLGVWGSVFVACENSPESVTISGDAHDMDTIVAAAQDQGIFTRSLRTDGKAYHSPHMATVGKQYEELIEHVLKKVSRHQLNQSWDPKVNMISSVTGTMVGPEHTCTSAYWRSNLESRVQFKTAIELLIPAPEAFDFVEVGPHSVLELPVKQTLGGRGPIFYSSTLSRGKDGIMTILDLVGRLFVRGHAIEFDKVNSLSPLEPGLITAPKVLRDMPTYRWQYDSKLWTEPRISEQYRHRQYPPHDLLGTRVFNGSSLTATWRKLLSADNVQYTEDHKLGSTMILPGAAYLSIALQACCQLANSSDGQCATLFRQVDILKALAVPSTSTVELFTELRPASISNTRMSTDSWEFTIFTVSTKDTVTHAKGFVQINKIFHPVKLSQPQVDEFLEPQATRPVYDKWATKGLVYGPRFQSLTKFHRPRAKDLRSAMAKIHLRKGENSGSQQESEYKVHPILLDAVLQTGLIADATGAVENLRACVPVSIDSVHIANSLMLSNTGTTYAKARRVGFDASVVDAYLCDEQGQSIVGFQGVRMITYPGVETLQALNERHPYLRVIWKPDISISLRCRSNANFAQALDQNTSSYRSKASGQALDALSTGLDLIAHKRPTIRILELGHKRSAVTNRLLDVLHAETIFKRFQTYTLGSFNGQGQLLGRELRRASEAGSENTEHLALTSDAVFDVFVLPTVTTSPVTHPDLHFQTLSSHAAPGAVMLFLSENGGVPLLKTETVDLTLSCPMHSGISACLTRVKGPARVTYELSGHKIYLIHKDSESALSIMLCEKLTGTFNAPVIVLQFDQVSEATLLPNAIAIATVELETPILKTATEIDLKRFKLLIERTSTLIWVTGGGLLQGRRPDLSLYAGLSRAVSLEQPSSKFIAFDVDDFVSDPYTIASHIVGVLDQSLDDPTPDYEYVHHNGLLYVSRFMVDERMNQAFRHRGRATRITTTWEQAGRCQLAIDHVGQLDTLHFEQSSEPEGSLKPEFVEVHVKSVGLNAKDIYALNGKTDTKDSTCTLEYCGIITGVGSGVTDLAPGDRVVVMAPGHFRAYEQVPIWTCQKLRVEEDFSVSENSSARAVTLWITDIGEAACTLMLVFATALYGLQDRACLQAGESVLIHSASGGAGLAAIQIPKLIGAEIYATVGTAEKKQFLIQSVGMKPENIFSSRDSSMLPNVLKATNGRGVDVVFNSLTGEMLHDSFRALSPFGRFVEIGKRDILESGKLDLGIFNRGVTFTAFDLADLFYSSNPAHHRLWQRLCSRILELYRAHKITEIQPLKVFGVSDIEQAIRYFSSSTRVGKVAVLLDDPNSQVKVRPPGYSTKLSPLKSYIMVGCLGGLGRSLSKWMFDRGARNFVFLGRSGSDKPDAKKLVEDLQESGAAVVVVRGDVSCLEDVRAAVMHSARPIGGIIQAAMGLNEAIFTEMSEKFWHTGIDAKVLGTWNLHTAVVGRDDELDFFIMASSISGTIGSATEGNYCAANHFLDNFAKFRRSLGLPATSIGLGMISEVGYLHEHPEIEALLLRKGLRPLSEEEMLGVFDVVLSPPQGSSDDGNQYVDAHLLTGLEISGLQAQRDQGYDGHKQVLDDPRASILLQSFNGSNPQLDYSASIGKSLSGKIKEAIQSGGDLRETMHDVIAGKMANLILLPTNDIKPETTLSTFGMDSMLAAELRAYIYQASAVDVPFQTIMGDTTTISSLADMIAKEITQDQRQ